MATLSTLFRTSLFAGLLLAGPPGTVLADNPAKTDYALLHAVSNLWENRLVGVWDAQVEVGACAGGPTRRFRGLNAFHLGGTLTDTNFAPPTSRGPGVGTWVYDRREQVYRVRMTFFRYLADGSFDGVQDVHREITLGADGTTSSEVIYARALNPDDSLRVEQCGQATARKIELE
jgi:hypothetical protein